MVGLFPIKFTKKWLNLKVWTYVKGEEVTIIFIDKQGP
jgi:hypothetical protein